MNVDKSKENTGKTQRKEIEGRNKSCWHGVNPSQLEQMRMQIPSKLLLQQYSASI